MQSSAGRHSEDTSVTGWKGWQGKQESDTPMMRLKGCCGDRLGKSTSP